jgi:hypothetical protein
MLVKDIILEVSSKYFFEHQFLKGVLEKMFYKNVNKSKKTTRFCNYTDVYYN